MFVISANRCPPQRGTSQTAQHSSVREHSTPYMTTLLPAPRNKHAKLKNDFSPALRVPRRPGTPSNHHHALPSSQGPSLDPENVAPFRSRCRPLAPPAPSPPTTSAMIHDPSTCPSPSRSHPSPSKQPPQQAAGSRLHRCISGQQHASRTRSWHPSRPGGDSVGQAHTRCNSTAGLDPTARAPAARVSASASLF